MTTQITIRKEIERIRQVLAYKPEDIVTVVMWTPDGKDPPYNGSRIRIKALKVKQKV